MAEASTRLPNESGQAFEVEDIHNLGLETQTMGMWVFLLSEIMFFGAVFAAYIVYRYAYPGVFEEASHHLNVVIGSANTAVLLTSSFCMALAVSAASRGNRRSLVLFLGLTIVLGLAFLGLKYVEYAQEFAENLFPGGNFIYPGTDPARAKIFFSLYFTLTGLHAVHMILGILALSALAFFGWRGKFTTGRYAPVEMIGLYWHFVDIVWIFIFPLLYLINP